MMSDSHCHDPITVLDDEKVAVDWWQSTSADDRAFFMEKAGNTGRIHDAWLVFKTFNDGKALDAWMSCYIKSLQPKAP